MGLRFSPEAKIIKWILNGIFIVKEWSIDTKNGYDDLEVYMEYGNVFVSSTGINHAKMAALALIIWIGKSV